MLHGTHIRRYLPGIIVFIVILFVIHIIHINSRFRQNVIEENFERILAYPKEQRGATEQLPPHIVDDWARDGPIPSYVLSQRDRNTIIHEICGPKRSIWTLTIEQSMYLFKHMIVDDNHRLIYCYIPKAACSNWKRVMQVLSGKYQKVEDIHKLNHTDFNFLSSYNLEEVDYKLKNYFKFMFVRHPIDRLFSAWHNKFHQNNLDMQKKYGVSIVQKFRENPPENPQGDDVTLEEFFKYLAGTSINQYNEHWMPFTELCQPCYVDYNYIGIHEDLENEATTMIKHLGLSDKVTYPVRQHYYDKNGVPDDGKIAEWHEMLPETFQNVLKKYAQDFSLFGYPLPENIEQYIKERIQQNHPT